MSVAVVGTGASIITPTADLLNGRPADATRLQWLSAATPAITDVTRIQFTWSDAIVPGLCGLVGFNPLSIEADGFKFEFMGKRAGDSGFPYALGGNTLTQRTVTRGDGSTLILCVPDSGLTPIVGIEMAIYNDRLGAAVLTPSQFVDLGDFWVSPAFECDIDADWKLSYKDIGSSTGLRRSINNQPWPVLYPPARVLECKRSVIPFDDAFIDGSIPSYQTLRTLCGNGQPSIQIPRYVDQTGAFDAARVHATACFGISEFAEMDRGDGDYFSLSWTHQEVPALGA